ncbi:hypothetical protein SLEP1_g49411 [Rubroshorea leprosula]|uniref:Uncharacterized protein n=1 Tax=Rubroshorea leprosula TaxID=152421 RepID=A0AAV5LWQ9_9ROSI|nr:hypothetical protein SLEP1_g49411 [Rubroshorea leprosula]
MSSRTQPVQPAVARLSAVLTAPTRNGVETGSTSAPGFGPKIAFPEGFSLHETRLPRRHASAAEDEVGRVEECATRVEVERNIALNDLNSLRQWVLAANESLARAKEGLDKEIDEQGKSLIPSADTTMRLRWELNEDGTLVWLPSILEDEKEAKDLPSFDAWVAGVPELQVEPSSTPLNSQPAITPACYLPVCIDTSALVDLTDD